MTDWLVVAPEGDVYHKPADGCDEYDPAPRCADEAGYYRASWDTRRHSIAIAWFDPCAWCYGEIDQSNGAGNAPAVRGGGDD